MRLPPNVTGAGTLSPAQAQASIEKINDFMKQITTAGVTGLQLRREDLQEQMAINIGVDTPLRNRLNRIKGEGGAHDWYRLEPTVYAQGSFIGAGPAQTFFAAGGLPTYTGIAYQRVSAPYKIVGDIVSVTFHDQAAGRTYDDLRASQMKSKMLNVALIEEWALQNGNATTNPLEFDGLDVQVTAALDYTTPGTYGLTAGAVFLLTDYLTLACEQISTAGGVPRAVVYGYPVHTALSSLLLQQMYNIWQGTGQSPFTPTAGVGINVKSFDFGWGDTDLIRSRFSPTSSYGSTIFILDDQTGDSINNGNIIQMVDLEPINSVDLGIIATSWQTVIYEDTVLMVSTPTFQRKITNYS